MRKNFSFFINQFLKIPLPWFFIKKIEKYANLAQGKGWEGSIVNEINSGLSLLKEDPKIFIDIGANKGIFTKYFLEKFPNIKAHLFEPSAYNYKLIFERFSNLENIICNKLALSDFSSNSILFSNYSGSGLASLTKRRLDHFDIEMNNKEEINVIRFEEYWKNYNELIDYVKIDVEGNELNVLKGFGDHIYNVKLFQFEFGGTNIDTKTYFQDFWYFFIERQFKIYRITPRGLMLIKEYKEDEELFKFTNFIAINNLFENNK